MGAGLQVETPLQKQPQSRLASIKRTRIAIPEEYIIYALAHMTSRLVTSRTFFVQIVGRSVGEM